MIFILINSLYSIGSEIMNNIIRWHELMKLRIEGFEDNLPKFLEDKLRLHKFCAEHEINTSNIITQFSNPETINFNEIVEDSFVVKPSYDSSTRGVMLLNRTEIRNEFFDVLHNKLFTLNEIKEYQRKFFIENIHEENKIIVEEKIKDIDSSYIIPRDFKFYSFNGRVALILMIDRNRKPAISCWYDEDFQPIYSGIVECVAPYTRTLTYYNKPSNYKDLMDFASEVSKLIRVPFASIDVYSTKSGPLLGEITLTPGGIYYGEHYILSKAQERLMGRMWLEAKEELKL